jgi:nucleoside-diphosphate-sugar epimerase
MQVVEATKNMDVVFHCATAAPTGANALNNDLMFSVNVDGTRNVIEACVANGVPKLVGVGVGVGVGGGGGGRAYVCVSTDVCGWVCIDISQTHKLS